MKNFFLIKSVGVGIVIILVISGVVVLAGNSRWINATKLNSKKNQDQNTSTLQKTANNNVSQGVELNNEEKEAQSDDISGNTEESADEKIEEQVDGGNELKENKDNPKPDDNLSNDSPSISTANLNEPAGMTKIFQMNGTTKDWGDQFNYGKKWGNPKEGSTGPFTERVSVVNDGDAPSGKAVQVEWRKGDNSGFAGAAFWNDWTDEYGYLDEIYIRTTFRYSPNWDHHSSGTTKLFYYGAGDRSATEFYPQMYAYWGGELRWRDQSGSGDDGVFSSVDPDGDLAAGQFHTLEIHHVAQSQSGASDGSVRIWLDGKEIDTWQRLGGKESIKLSNPRWSWLGNESNVGFSGVQLGTYWGGSGDSKDHDDWMRWGEIYISGK